MKFFVQLRLLAVLMAVALLGACSNDQPSAESSGAGQGAEADTYERGPHGGRMLIDGPFAVELAIFEQGVPPEFRVWATYDGEPLDSSQVDVQVRLTRTGDRVDEIEFEPEGDLLRGDQVVYEPHSFLVTLDARAKGQSYSWEYENFEGRTQIEPEMAEALGIETSIAGPAVLTEFIEVFGRVVPDQQRIRTVSARFEGAIQSVEAQLGAMVAAGDRLVTIESNESLRPYTLSAPIAGIVTERNANPGEQTNGRRLFTIIDTSRVWANLSVYLKDRRKIAEGAPVTITSPLTERTVEGTIDQIEAIAEDSQAVIARVEFDNADGGFAPGTFITAQIKAAEHSVPLAVKRSGLQPFRDFTVVYGKFGDVYEVRMLELGRQDDEWTEVLGGIEPGTPYVSTNSYVVKADVEKSGASHDH
ncbi:MAG: secretion protein HlyD [Gammaproteobacteria bacterium]|nr:secretion protein HlyD [Gammaproteobacteria bacterium]|tara:strand:- start:15736 stop:16986 length:1251 start_codon:yes stop_codon:yes gene_type:complete